MDYHPMAILKYSAMIKIIERKEFGDHSICEKRIALTQRYEYCLKSTTKR